MDFTGSTFHPHYPHFLPVRQVYNYQSFQYSRGVFPYTARMSSVAGKLTAAEQKRLYELVVNLPPGSKVEAAKD